MHCRPDPHSRRSPHPEADVGLAYKLAPSPHADEPLRPHSTHPAVGTHIAQLQSISARCDALLQRHQQQHPTAATSLHYVALSPEDEQSLRDGEPTLHDPRFYLAAGAAYACAVNTQPHRQPQSAVTLVGCEVVVVQVRADGILDGPADSCDVTYHSDRRRPEMDFVRVRSLTQVIPRFTVTIAGAPLQSAA